MAQTKQHRRTEALLTFRRAPLAVVLLLLTTLIAMPSGLAHAAPSQRLAVDVVSTTPTVTTADGPATVTVRGEVKNTSDTPITSAEVRVQRGPQTQTNQALRQSLRPEIALDTVALPPVKISGTILPGATAPFVLTAPVSADNTGKPSFGVNRVGVYPLVVTASGTDSQGTGSEISSRSLLSVAGLPANSVRASNGQTAAGDSVADNGSAAATVDKPMPFTLLWPLSAPSKLAPGVPGGGSQEVRLVDDQMASSLNSGGRLWNLVHTMGDAVGVKFSDPAETPEGSTPNSAPTSPDASDNPEPAPAPTPRSDQQRALAASACLAIDPSLLITVQAMSRGYAVTTDPTKHDAPTERGQGSNAAARWLSDLRTLAGQMCVVATPFAGTDLPTVAAVGDPGLTDAALNTADIVDSILNVQSVRGLTIPATGSLGPSSANLVRSSEIPGALVAANGLSLPPRPSPDGRFSLGEGLAAASYDPSITAALAAMGDHPSTPPMTPTAQEVPLESASAGARTAAAVGAIMFPALAATDELAASKTADDPVAATTGRSEIVVPPPMWAPRAADARAIIDAASTLLTTGLAEPMSVQTLSRELARTAQSDDNVGQVQIPRNTVGAISSPPDRAVVERARFAVARSWRLQSSLVQRPELGDLTPTSYLSPLREDLLRAMAFPQSRSPGNNADALGPISIVTDSLRQLTTSVSILSPGGKYTLASERSPLLLVVRNELPLPIRVKLNISEPDSISVDDVGTLEIPPRGTRQIQVPTMAQGSRALTVQIGLTSAGDARGVNSGVPLGDPIELSVHSNAYGKPLFYLTIGAAVLLVLLAGRRLWHRFRGQPDPADADRPEPNERERMIAEHPERAEYRAQYVRPMDDAGGDDK